MTSAMIDAINAHRAAWQAFQDAPEGDAALAAEDCETEALMALLRTVPQDQTDLAALNAYLDWWVVEEALPQIHKRIAAALEASA